LMYFEHDLPANAFAFVARENPLRPTTIRP
jgi:hypothetical protein